MVGFVRVGLHVPVQRLLGPVYATGQEEMDMWGFAVQVLDFGLQLFWIHPRSSLPGSTAQREGRRQQFLLNAT